MRDLLRPPETLEGVETLDEGAGTLGRSRRVGVISRRIDTARKDRVRPLRRPATTTFSPSCANNFAVA